MSGHTPGPWKVERAEIGRWTEWYVESEPGHYIWCNGEDYSGCEDEADARLIAAAPDMLQALRDAVCDCWARSGCGKSDHDAGCTRCAVQRVAIAKATGGIP